VNTIDVIVYPLPPPEYTLTVTVDPVGSGHVTKNPDQATYTSGTPVELTAHAYSGYRFSQWTGDLTGSDNPKTILMDSNKTVTAHFVILPTLLSVESNGTRGKILSLPTEIKSEPRAGRIKELRFNFNNPPTGILSGFEWYVGGSWASYNGVSVMSQSIIGNTLVVTFTPALEDDNAYRFDVSGISQTTTPFIIRGLVGDCDMNDAVGSGDRGLMYANWGSTTNIICDINEDGVVGSGDRGLAYANWGQTTPLP
jgi:uncharacterized repeat protein (TIGR02543 family)